ncbi:discoidin domain-containing protein [Paenibacillus alkalitolerans]|uniref:discoidin domain-containing protein n=1 Tax=Paenibacillus alkalitolerans TaxID=2799335 RepID=UPI0018F656F6|nr:discoidin domain-containing protein [Paenibacillus alkalitolerans]
MKVRNRSSSKVLQRFLPLLVIVSMIAAFLPASAGTVAAETTSESLMTDYLPTIYEVIDESGFKHPGVGLTKETLENLRTQVRAQKEPWITYFNQMVTSVNPSGQQVAARTVSSRYSGGCFCSQGFNERFIWDGLTAYTQALMYVITGDEVYRANAMHIIRNWEQMDPANYAYFTDAHIHTGIPLYRMVTAAEILRYTSTQTPELEWTDKDTADFTNNLIIPVTDTFNHTNYRFMNQHLYPLIGSISGYIFTGNLERYKEGVEWFTVNKTAVDQHVNGSIKRLFRLVDTNAATGEKVDTPQVQIVEMGRDQAHSTGDVINVSILSRLLQAQGTKVDPVEGTVSTAENAVTAYDFLDKRILAGADYFARYMNGYDTPWIPTEARMREDGSPVIYQVISNEYHGRIGGNVYDLYYYYKYEQGLDMEQSAPYFTEMFKKRTNYYWASRDSGGEYWLYIPKEAEAEGAAYLPKVNPNPNWKEIEDRFTNLDGNSTAMQEGDVSFVRIKATESGSKIALVQSDSSTRVIGYKIRTNGAAKLEAFGQTITLPDTQGQWRYVFYNLPKDRWLWTMNYFTIIGNGTTVDIDHINVNAANELTPPVFKEGNTALKLFAYAGSEATLHYDFSATDAGTSDVVTYRIANAPEGAVFDTSTGAFDWKPTQAGTYAFVVEASDGTTVSTRDVTVTVANDRQSAVDAVIAPYDANTDYIWATLDTYKQAYDDTMSVMNTATDSDFYQKLAALNDAVQGLELTTPLHTDGSINYLNMFLSSDFNPRIFLDNVSSTFGNSSTNLGVHVDFGPNFRVSASKFQIQARAGFPERGGGIAMFGSNDKETWTRLTPEVTPVSADMHTLTVSPELQNEQFRFLKIQMINKPYDAPWPELSEFRIFGKRHEVINKISSVSIGSDQAFGGRIVMGDTAKLTFQSTEAIQNVNVTIQGVPATVHSDDGLNWTAEAVMGPDAAPGSVKFILNYQTAEGIDAPETLFTTDGSRLILVDESDVIRDVTSIAAVSDSYGRSPADAIAAANALFDNNPMTSTDYRLNGSGAGAWVKFDFGQGGYAQLSYVELLARQDGYYTRINGTVIQGSNDNATWKTISTGAVSTRDWQILQMTDKNPYRYIRIINGNNWFGNMAEVRFHGTSKVLTKINSVSISSDQAVRNRIEPGDTVNLAFTSMEPINSVNVKIQGEDATVKSEDNINWTAEAVMGSNAAPGPVNFSINYKTSEGLDAPEKTFTTDGSSLILADESDLIRGVTSITDVSDSSGRSPTDAIGMANALFDDHPGTSTDYRLNGSGAGAWVEFDFRGAYAKLKYVELLARQDGYYTRIKGAIIQGSNDNSNWTTISPLAVSTPEWQILTITNNTPYRYIRIFNGNNWFGNMAEVRFHGDLDYDAAYFDSIVLAADGYTKGSYYLYQQKVKEIKAELANPEADKMAILNELLQASSILETINAITPSMVTANTVSWDDKYNAAANGWRAFDGDPNTSPDTKTAAGWVTVDLGEGNAIMVTGIKFIPRSGFADRMNGALIQGSNDGVNFNTLHTINGVSGQQWYTQAIDNQTAYRYLRYYTPKGYGNVGELEFLFVDRTLLTLLLNEADQVVADHYTADSYAALQTAVANAKSVDSNAQASQSDVDSAANSLKLAMDSLIYKITAFLDPAEPNGTNGWYTTGPVNVTLSTYGRAEYSLDGGDTWQGYTESLTFNQDGKHTVSYRSRNEAGIAGDVQTVDVQLDTTAPTITVTGLVYGTYYDSTDITPIVALDDLLSGVDGSKTTVTLDTYVIQQGETIPLYTLPLGSHTLIVTASDLAGNTSSQPMTFETTTSIDSMKRLVARFEEAGWISNAGIADSLQDKLDDNDLSALVYEVKAQSGKLISKQAAQYLLRDAEYLLNNQE